MPREKSKDPAAPITVTMPQSLLWKVKQAARNYDSVSAWLRMVIREHLQEAKNGK